MLAVLDFIATHTGFFVLSVLAVYSTAVLWRDQLCEVAPPVKPPASCDGR
jgi:hypothetical protein